MKTGSIEVKFLSLSPSGSVDISEILNPEDVRNSLNLGSLALQDSTNVSIIGGSISNTDITISSISNTDITIGTNKTLDVSNGNLTLADDQIPISKVNGLTEALLNSTTNYSVYGIKWNTANTSPTLTKGVLVGEQWKATDYTEYPIQSLIKRCVMNSSGSLLYYLNASNSIYKANQTTPLTAGITDGSSANKLICSSETFLTKGVQAGMWVKNTTNNTYALITAVDSETQLSICYDIFASGEGFDIGTANPQADGCVMSEIPYFYYVWVEDTTDTYILISQSLFTFRKPISGDLVESQLHPAFIPDGVEQEYAYIGSFESVWYSSAAGGYSDHDGSTVGISGDKAVSLPGYKPLTYQYRRNATAYQGFAGLHAALGSDYRTQSFYEYEALWILMITEWGTLDGQTALPGYTDASGWNYARTRKTGRTIDLGNSSGLVTVDLTGIDSDLSGIIASGKAVANSYRGIENPFGHIWKWIDGINSYWVSFSESLICETIYLSNNPTVWAENTSENYEDTGLSFPSSGGYTSALHPGRLLTKSTTGGSSSYYLCDYFYAPYSSGFRGLISGGHLNSSVAAGYVYLLTSYSGSGYRTSNIGARAAVKKS